MLDKRKLEEIRKFLPLMGKWQVEDTLGSGSYGTVWLAVNQDGNIRTVRAIKHISIPKNDSDVDNLISEGICDDPAEYYDRMKEDLTKEIEVMVELQEHESIVRYLDHEFIPKASGIGYDLFIHMEKLDCVTTRYNEKRMNEYQVLKLGKDIARAIIALDRKGYIHRDIKPQNLFVNEYGHYKLGDYGTAKVMGSGAASGVSVKGTYNYMAPELFMRQTDKINCRVDIYSLGIVMYRMLNNNRNPFLPTDSTSVSEEQVEEANGRRFQGTEVFNAPINCTDPRLRSVIMKCCAHDPEDRYQTGEELLEALEEIRIPNLNRQKKHEKVQPGPSEEKLPNDDKTTPIKNGNGTHGDETTPLNGGNGAAAGRTPAGDETTPLNSGKVPFGDGTTPVNMGSMPSFIPQNQTPPPQTQPPRKKSALPMVFIILAVILVLAGGTIGGLYAAGILPPKWTCSYCGTKNAPDALFCNECGNPKDANTDWICPNKDCGHINAADALYCNECGTKKK